MKSTLTPSFLAWRRRSHLSTLGAVAVLSTLSMRTQRAGDDRDMARRVSSIASERAADSESIADTDRVESPVSQFDRDDVIPHGLESSAILLRSERARLAREVAAYRIGLAHVRFVQVVAAMPLALTA